MKKEQDAILGPCYSICFGNVYDPSNDFKMLRLMQHLLPRERRTEGDDLQSLLSQRFRFNFSDTEKLTPVLF